MPQETDVKFLNDLEDIKPDILGTEAIVMACKELIADYAQDATTAMVWFVALGVALRDEYATENDGECMCPKCTAHRKANAN